MQRFANRTAILFKSNNATYFFQSCVFTTAIKLDYFDAVLLHKLVLFYGFWCLLLVLFCVRYVS
jgi:hypothetical protein